MAVDATQLMVVPIAPLPTSALEVEGLKFNPMVVMSEPGAATTVQVQAASVRMTTHAIASISAVSASSVEENKPDTTLSRSFDMRQVGPVLSTQQRDVDGSAEVDVEPD